MKKKLSTLFMISLFPISLLGGSGDVNNDGKIDETDVAELVKFIMGNSSNGFQKEEADVNGDDRIDAVDIVHIVNKIKNDSYLITPNEMELIDSKNFQEIKIEIESSSELFFNNVEFSFLEDSGNWMYLSDQITTFSNGKIKGIYTISVTPNTTANSREGKIVVLNKKYDFQEIISVKTEPYFMARKKEYHLVNQGMRYLNVEPETSIDYLEAGGWEYKVIDCEGDWLRYDDGSLQYDNNWTGKERKARLLVKTVNYDYSDIVTVIQYPATIANGSEHHTIACQPSGDIVEIPIIGNTTLDVIVSSELPLYLHRLDDEIAGDNRIIRLKVDENESEQERYSYNAFTIKVGDGSEEKFYFAQPGKNAPSFAEQLQALKEFYNETNHTTWRDNTNWMSDKPFNQWHGVNNTQWGDTIIGNYILQFNLDNNNILGNIPACVNKLMPTTSLSVFNIDNNGFYGKIPEAVISHPSWEKVGWNFVMQSLWKSGRCLLDFDDLNLKLPNYEIDLVNGNCKTSDELFAKNKVTVVMTDNPSMAMGNVHLAYHNKGYGTVVSAYYWDDEKREKIEKNTNDFPIQDIDYVWNCEWWNNELSGLLNSGTWYVFDNNANLLACYMRDWSISDEWYASKVDSICQKYLGEPEEHVPYTPDYYTSTDYSKDGEVKLLQKAIVGRGIDLVFLGEGFTDLDMDDNGIYDQQMEQAMEQFFSEEPYTSLRNRFNVYAVKAVSPNEEFSSYAVHAINEDDAKAFDYARKALGDDVEIMMVNVIYKSRDNDNDFFDSNVIETQRSHCSMYYGSYVAYNMQGGRVINHESGGHGFALLADEYVEGGNEGAVFDEDSRNYLDQLWVQYGYGANVDWHSNPEEVKWSQFINDERYANEHISVYEGAHLAGKGCYRPTENSIMRTTAYDSNFGYNAPSREQIYKRVMQLSEGETWSYDYEKFVEFDAPTREKNNQIRAQSCSVKDNKKQQKRIESRPPTFYEGTWHDAGRCKILR